MEIAAALLKLYPDNYKVAALDTLMVDKESLADLMDGEDPRRIADDWRARQDTFKNIRAKYLLY